MATVDDVAMQLAAHERIMQDRYEHLEKGLKKLESAESAEGAEMSTVNVENPMGGLLPMMMGGNWGGGSTAGAVGGGLGAGVLGGILGGALLGGNGNGLLGNRNNGVVDVGVTPAQFQAGLNSVTTANDTTAIMQGIADIKASVPLAEAQVQLALAGSTGEIRSHLGAVENGLVAGQASINKNVSDAIASSLASQNSINMNVLTSAAATREAMALYGNANLVATKDAATATALAVANSTEKIIAALNDQNVANLQRQLTVAESTLAEDRARSRSREVEVNVTQTVNQNNQQMQFQAQQQQQAILLNNLLMAVGGLQSAVATNTNMVIGNTGAVATGTQTANPINVRT